MDNGQSSEQLGVNEDQQDLGLPTLITLMRIYDVQMAILTKMDESFANHLNDIHERGEILFSLPRLAPDVGETTTSVGENT